MLAPSDRGRRGPGLALVATAVAAFGVLTLLALHVSTPRILTDELVYTGAAASLAAGDGLLLRGEEYGFGPLYPVILAPILALAADREAAYPLFKVANALLFALTTVPVYFLARRLVPRWWSVAVAALSVAIPSSVYVSLVMTESVAYLASSIALLAIVLALERSTAARQFAALGAIGLATLARPQFAALLVAYVVALGVQRALVPGPRVAIRMLWPTLATFGGAVVAFAAVPLVTGSSYEDVLGSYGELWRDYSPVEVARWLVYHATALELYVAVVPVAVAPIVLARLWRDARSGSTRSAAFLALFVTANVSLLLVASTFATTEFAFGLLHDRYLFYLVPLWLVVLAVWLHEGMPRPVLALVTGIAAALVLPAVTPTRLLTADEGGGEVAAVVTHLWGAVHEQAIAFSPDHLSGRRLLALFVLAAVLVTVLLPRRYAPALAGLLATVFLVSGTVAWSAAYDASSDSAGVLGETRDWVEAEVPAGSTVTSLWVEPCGSRRGATAGLLLTEFFNPSVARATHIGAPDGSLLPSHEARLGSRGAVLLLEPDEPLTADYLLTPPEVVVDADPVATGTNVPLTLWSVRGPVRTMGGEGIRALQGLRCRDE